MHPDVADRDIVEPPAVDQAPAVPLGHHAGRVVRDLAHDLDLVPAPRQSGGEGVQPGRPRGDLRREVLADDQDPHRRAAPTAETASAKLPSTSWICSSLIDGKSGSEIARWE